MQFLITAWVIAIGAPLPQTSTTTHTSSTAQRIEDLERRLEVLENAPRPPIDAPIGDSRSPFDLGGYMRFRYDAFVRMDLDTFYRDAATGRASGPFAPGFAPPVPSCRSAGTCGQDRRTLAGGNMRVRLEPSFDPLSRTRIRARIDILDNVVLGSTPIGQPIDGSVLAVPFDQSGRSRQRLGTGVGDTIQFKNVYGEFRSPWAAIRGGRRPRHFGMGLMLNSGSRIDDDRGDASDGIDVVSTGLLQLISVPGSLQLSYDWLSTGPTSDNFYASDLQPFDLEQLDDLGQVAMVYRYPATGERMSDVLDRSLEPVGFAFAGYLAFIIPGTNTVEVTSAVDDPDRIDVSPRTVSMATWSLWARIETPQRSSRFRFIAEAEYAGRKGERTDRTGVISVDAHAAAARITADDRNLRMELLVVVASGDSAPGWGVREVRTPAAKGAWDGGQFSDSDRRITNFRAHNSFIVDMILWRELIGAITDAGVIRGSIQYNWSHSLGARIDVIQSYALTVASTPSSSLHGGGNANLGTEIDLKAFFADAGNADFWVQYGVLFPGGGLSRLVDRLILQAHAAHTVQLLGAVRF